MQMLKHPNIVALRDSFFQQESSAKVNLITRNFLAIKIFSRDGFLFYILEELFGFQWNRLVDCIILLNPIIIWNLPSTKLNCNANQQTKLGSWNLFNSCNGIRSKHCLSSNQITQGRIASNAYVQTVHISII